jgi:hypothetical protein
LLHVVLITAVVATAVLVCVYTSFTVTAFLCFLVWLTFDLWLYSMCRNPYTEYCSGEYDPEGILTFCTNGGKCKSDFIAAKVAPGNLSVNQDYQHLGCVCNKAFYGPHCEFLRYDEESLSDQDAEHTEVESGAEKQADEGGDFSSPDESSSPLRTASSLNALGFLVLFSSLSLGMLLTLIIILRRRRYRHGQTRRSNNYSGTAMARVLEGDESDEDEHVLGFPDDGLAFPSTTTQTRQERSPLYSDIQVRTVI